MPRSYRMVKRKTAAAGASDTLVGEPVEGHHSVVITRIVARDITSAQATSNIIGIMSGGSKIPLDFLAGAVAANATHGLACELVLQPGEAIYAEFNDATAADELDLAVFGYYQ
jgi:hypothetical protein